MYKVSYQLYKKRSCMIVYNNASFVKEHYT